MTTEPVGNELVVYSKFSGDLSRAVQKVTALTDIRPENRVVVDGGMYIASCSNLRLDPAGFLGYLYLAYYEEMNEKNEEVVEKNLTRLVLDKIFSRVKGRPDIEHEGKKYQLAWRSWSGRGDYSTHWIILNGHVFSEAVGKMKVRLAEDREILVANHFLSLLFNPVINSLLEAHTTMGRF